MLVNIQGHTFFIELISNIELYMYYRQRQVKTSVLN